MSDKTLATVGEDLLSIYKANVDAGSENLGASMPVLTVIGKDAEDVETIDGKKAVNGDFYMKSTKKIYKNPEVSIIYTEDAQLSVFNKGNKPELVGQMKFNSLIVGMILEDQQPFMMYIAGKSLSPFFDWKTNISTLKAEYGIPMYAFVNKFTSERQENEWGKFYVKKLEVVKGKIVSDLILADKLLKGIPTAKVAVKTAVEVANGTISTETLEVLDSQKVRIEEKVVVDDINF